ncbi:DUF1616 domain-containing protein [Methanoregula sp.]|uniref:DUF1616 domain-containing protein n=1 Tax=Methanoregula sp. TaxID=2052170 RepID=UPI00260DAF3C|nr:DUF1616 domain-containing protein [Methanoregula sp.]MDD5141925.1 DUF1616 domain-containing protein [Methanoregula sp.]
MDQPQHPYDTVVAAFALTRVPRDLLACEIWLLCAILCIYVPFLNESFFRILFGIPLVLFIPGYALIAALFPAARDLDGIERVALSFGLSIAIVPLTGLVLNYTPWGIRLDPIIISLSLITIFLCLLAQYRRAQVPEEERFFVPFQEIQNAIETEFFPREGSSRTDRILSIILLVAIVAAIATTVFVIVVPKEGEKFTEFFILGEKQKAADYPTRLVTGMNSSLFIGIGNHEYRPVNYTVETYFMKMTFDEKTNTSTLHAMDRIDRFPVQVAHNETTVMPCTIMPAATGDYNRLEFLLFNEIVPDDGITGTERINQSYRDLHLWVSVRSP